ncbi:hypothetical protein [Novosphingobium aquae]|uniref:Uncharacterized protein n=1 Tax=Novosphingobium aquae TaxID=3133435 RepID=A0ABU8SC21_9SPHN
MITIHDDATLAAALAAACDNTSRALIERIAHDAKASDLWDLTCIVLIDDDDTDREFEEVLGYPPSLGPLGGEGAAVEPYWSWCEQHRDWTELLITAGDSGFAWFVIMPSGWFEARIGIG